MFCAHVVVGRGFVDRLSGSVGGGGRPAESWGFPGGDLLAGGDGAPRRAVAVVVVVSVGAGESLRRAGRQRRHVAGHFGIGAQGPAVDNGDVDARAAVRLRLHRGGVADLRLPARRAVRTGGRMACRSDGERGNARKKPPLHVYSPHQRFACEGNNRDVWFMGGWYTRKKK